MGDIFIDSDKSSVYCLIPSALGYSFKAEMSFFLGEWLFPKYFPFSSKIEEWAMTWSFSGELPTWID